MAQRCTDFAGRVRDAFAMRSEYARKASLLELVAEVQSGGPVTPETWEVLAQGLSRETSDMVLVEVWLALSRLPPAEPLIACAREAVKSPLGQQRQAAIRYLATVEPEQRRALYEELAEDEDPFVQCELAWAILPLDVASAVKAWIKAMGSAPAGMADETIPAWIGQYGGLEAIPLVEGFLKKSPKNVTLRTALWYLENWNRIEYLDQAEHSGDGDGYKSRCPGCDKTVFIYDGHVGERARCRDCGKAFIIPAPER